MTDKTIRKVYKDREEWLGARAPYIGASEIASVMGAGFESPLELWQRKTGMKAQSEKPESERMAFGNNIEDGLRAIFPVMHPEYHLSFTPFTVLRQKGKYDFLSCTPDGELIEVATGRKGLYESKSATLLSKADVEKWNYKIPDNYFYQICQGMYCGGFEFAVVFALLLDKEKDAQIRAYKFERVDCADTILAIQREGAKFVKAVKDKEMPSVKIEL